MTDDVGELVPTPGQTVGPFFHYALPYAGDRDLVAPGRADAVRLRGTVHDGAGAAVPDALVEIWQTDPAGQVVAEQGSLRRDGHRFTGFGRSTTDRTGEYVLTTLVPGPHAPDAAAFFSVTIFARGLLHRLLTRAYLPAGHGNDADALERDPLLAGLDADRRVGLVAEPEARGYRFDVHLAGERETVFLTHPRTPYGG